MGGVFPQRTQKNCCLQELIAVRAMCESPRHGSVAVGEKVMIDIEDIISPRRYVS